MGKKALIRLIQEREKEEYDNPTTFNDYVHNVADCIGKDREALIAFINAEEPKRVYALSEAYEEIMENFPGDNELERLFAEKVLP